MPTAMLPAQTAAINQNSQLSSAAATHGQEYDSDVAMHANLPDNASNNMLFEMARFMHSMLALLSMFDKIDKFCAACQMICSQTKPRIDTDMSPLVSAWSTAYLA